MESWPARSFQRRCQSNKPELLLDYARAEPGLSLLAYSSMLFGSCTRAPLPEPYDHPGRHAPLAVLREVAGELGARPKQVVLRARPSPRLGVSRGALSTEVDDLIYGLNRMMHSPSSTWVPRGATSR